MNPIQFSFRELNQEAINSLADLIKQNLNSIEFNSFALGASYPKTFSEEKIKELKKSFQFVLVQSISNELKKEINFEDPEIFILVDLIKSNISFQLKPVYLIGRYNKFQRNIAQTIHYCFHCHGKGCSECNGTGKATKDSVQELIAGILEPAFNAEGNKFHGEGREDVDVLMLGKGRPFVIELMNPMKRILDLNELEKEINSRFKERIKVSDLTFTGKEKIAEIKQRKHEKIYKALVSCEKKIDEKSLPALKGKKISVEQETPSRVEKRRAFLLRKHESEIINFQTVNEKEFFLEIKASAGMYVKEFISGDEGKTNPSINSLLEAKCSCMQLDVLQILDESEN